MNEIIKHCLPDEEGDDVSWFYRLNEFEKQETKRQIAFKRSRWPDLADGVWSKRPNYQYPHILPENNMGKALFEPIAEEVISYFNRNDIALHSEALNLRSSQICCLNVLFPLRQDKTLAKLFLDTLLPNLKDIENIEFEYTGPQEATEWLGEPACGKRGQNRTSIDAAIWWMDNLKRRYITLLEWKYTERSFGSCGGFESDSNIYKNQCHTLDATSLYPERQCFLTICGSQTHRYYWEHLAEAGIDASSFKDVDGCPFRGPFYQLLRQSLLAAYLRQKMGNIDNVEVVVLSFKGNGHLLKCPRYLISLIPNKMGSVLDAWNSVITNAPPARLVTIEEIMAVADKTLEGDNAWRRYIWERYGV